LDLCLSLCLRGGGDRVSCLKIYVLFICMR
jgi:hypothetical protein